MAGLGKPSEAVADEAVAAVREHHASDAAVELHLADQLLLPLSFAAGTSDVHDGPRPSGHLMTNAWTIGQFAIADISIEDGTPCRVRIEPRESALSRRGAVRLRCIRFRRNLNVRIPASCSLWHCRRQAGSPHFLKRL